MHLFSLRLVRSRSAPVFVTLSVLLLAACGGGGIVDNGPLDLAAVQSSTDLAAPSADLLPATDLAPRCRKSGDCQGQLNTCCGGVCIDPVADAKNCGACGLSCGAGKVCCQGSCADVTADPSNCGACGKSCSSMHASSACVASACTLGPCDSGWGNCNLKPDDGCEANLHVDGANCGACGKACAFTNALGGCSDGCYLRACTFGYDDCDGDPKNGCEASVLSDPKHCGSCATNCGIPAHATASCALASCLIKFCDMGYSDCNNLFKDGCETFTGNDANNCGACGLACPMGLVCKGSQCTCPNCNVPNASSKCINQMCIFDKCNPGFADCNNNLKDGCEIDLTSDLNNCGACGVACGNNKMVCTNGACMVQTVPAGCLPTADPKIAICISNSKVNTYMTAAQCMACTEKGLTNACVDVKTCIQGYTPVIIQTLYNVRTGLNCVASPDQVGGCGWGEIMTPAYQVPGNCPTPEDCVNSVNWQACTYGTGTYDAYIFGVCNLP